MDQRFREAKRRARETGDPGDLVIYYTEALRAGHVSLVQLDCLASLGDPIASLTSGRPHLVVPLPEIYAQAQVALVNLITGPPEEVSPEMFVSLGNIVSIVRVEARNQLRSGAAEIRESMRYETSLTRSGWLPHADSMDGIANELSQIGSGYGPDSVHLIQQACNALTFPFGITTLVATIIARLKDAWKL